MHRDENILVLVFGLLESFEQIGICTYLSTGNDKSKIWITKELSKLPEMNRK